MLQVRYGGCSGCLDNAKAILNKAGLRAYKDYEIHLHDDFRNEDLYQRRPDFLEAYVGAIIYNPENKKFINVYPDNKVIKYSQSFVRALEELLK